MSPKYCIYIKLNCVLAFSGFGNLLKDLGIIYNFSVIFGQNLEFGILYCWFFQDQPIW